IAARERGTVAARERGTIAARERGTVAARERGTVAARERGTVAARERGIDYKRVSWGVVLDNRNGCVTSATINHFAFLEFHLAVEVDNAFLSDAQNEPQGAIFR